MLLEQTIVSRHSNNYPQLTTLKILEQHQTIKKSNDRSPHVEVDRSFAADGNSLAPWRARQEALGIALDDERKPPKHQEGETGEHDERPA